MNMIVDVLIVWRLTHLINIEDGPYKVFFNFKVWLKKKRHNFLFEMFQCFLCLSVWVGWAIAMLEFRSHSNPFAYGIALSGAAILLQFISGDK